MLDYIYRQIVTWPGTRNRSPRPALFKMDFERVLKELEYETDFLGADGVIFNVDLYSPRDIRMDGKLVSGKRVASPAVIVEFTANKVEGKPQLSYPCDTFSQFKDNLRAVAGILTALRTVDRYGGRTGGRQYAGFKALPSASGETLTPASAALVIAKAAGVHENGILTDPNVAKAMIRQALGRTHPDRNAGDRTEYDRVDKARSVLTSHHGVSL